MFTLWAKNFNKRRSDSILDLAIKYKDQLQRKFQNTWFDDKYKFWNSCVYHSEFSVDKDTWNRHQFVSVDKNSDDKVIGYIGYNINRETNFCWGLNIINFTDKVNTFSLDLGKTLEDIFDKFKFNKLKFTVVIGNPIEHSYDKIIEKYGGRIVGVQVDEVKLVDGELYDRKLYEITRAEYLKHKR